MSTIHRITPDSQPVFPCWLWYLIISGEPMKWARHEREPAYPAMRFCTHWHPDQPDAPAVTPGITTERDVRNTVTPWSHPDEVGYFPAAPAQGETPRTDAYQREFESGHGYPLAVHVEFAKKQEREIATLRAQVAQLTSERDEARDCGQRVDDKLAAAESELAELRKDKARLDWLFERGLCWRDCDKDNPHWIVGPGTEWLYKVHNGRAAIDAALNQLRAIGEGKP